MFSPIVTNIRMILLESGLAEPNDVQGCTQAEIAEIEARTSMSLPSVYHKFLLQVGRRAGLFYEGSDMFYPRVLELREAACELLQEAHNNFVLPIDAFVFFMHQGYQFMYFRVVAGDDDPPIYNYIEGDTMPKQAYESFSGFVKNSVEEHNATLIKLLY